MEKMGQQTRCVWIDTAGREVIEQYLVNGMAHGTPLSTLGRDSREVAGPHLPEAGISSTLQIANFWRVDERVQRRSNSTRREEWVRADPTQEKLGSTATPNRIAPILRQHRETLPLCGKSGPLS